MPRSRALRELPTRLPREDTRLSNPLPTRSRRSGIRRAAIAGMLFGGTLGASDHLHAGGGSYSYGNLHFGSVVSLTIDIDGSWTGAYASRGISAVNFTSSGGPYQSLNGGLPATNTSNGYDYTADGVTDVADPSRIFDQLSARASFGYPYSGQTDPYPTIKNGYIEYVLNLTSAVTIDLYGEGTAGGVLQPGLVVTVDSASISSGATIAAGNRTLRYTWTNYSQPNNQFGMFATLNAAAAPVPGGGLATLLVAAIGIRRRRRD